VERLEIRAWNGVEGAIGLADVFVFFSVLHSIRSFKRYVVKHQAPPPPL